MRAPTFAYNLPLASSPEMGFQSAVFAAVAALTAGIAESHCTNRRAQDMHAHAKQRIADAIVGSSVSVGHSAAQVTT
jgi:hypothetical protein